MRTIVATSNSLLGAAVFACSLLIATVIVPSAASAQTVSQTRQILPPNQNTCQQVTVTSIEPHVYGGLLESFDVTINDQSNAYVGVLAQVGATGIPLNFITRWAGYPSGLRIHVDTPATAVAGGVPVVLTLLESPVGQPTCMTVVSFQVNSSSSVGNIPSTPSTTTSGSGATSQPATPTNSNSGSSVSSSNNGNTNIGGSQSNGGMTTGTKATTSTSTGRGSIMGSIAVGDLGKSLSAICSGNNAYRLWFILLIVYILIVTIVVFSEPWFLEESVLASTAAILVPLILLLGFWYFSSACRAASWIPVIACVIAIAGLFLAFREYEVPPLLPAAPENK